MFRDLKISACCWIDVDVKRCWIMTGKIIEFFWKFFQQLYKKKKKIGGFLLVSSHTTYSDMSDGQMNNMQIYKQYAKDGSLKRAYLVWKITLPHDYQKWHKLVSAIISRDVNSTVGSKIKPTVCFIISNIPNLSIWKVFIYKLNHFWQDMQIGYYKFNHSSSKRYIIYTFEQKSLQVQSYQSIGWCLPY